MTWATTARRIRVPMGFLFAAFFIWQAHPSAASIAWSLLLTVPGVLLRAWASGFVKKNAELAVTGPYAFTRNPLYLGSMLIAFGFAAASRNWWIAALLAALFLVIYVPVIRGEEEFLRRTFPDFQAYCASVPRILPRVTPAHFETSAPGGFAFSPALYRKHREYNAALGTCAIYLVLLVKLYLKLYLRHSA
jgi:protein-S-isoprenylcysteine O-methyltransferase Ste14